MRQFPLAPGRTFSFSVPPPLIARISLATRSETSACRLFILPNSASKQGSDQMAGRLAQAKNFVDWLHEHGGYVHPDLNLFAQLDNGDLGVMAEKAIREGDQLLVVPKAVCIYTGSKGQAQPDSEALHIVRSMKLSPFLSTVLLLMAGRAQGAKCSFAPYIDTLPASHDCLMSWSEEEREELEGTDLGDRKETAKSVFLRQVQPLLAKHTGVWPPEACGATAFEWACGMVQSRAFHLVAENWVTMVKSEGTDLYLIPGIDMINHSTVPARRSTALRLVEEPLTVKCGEPLQERTLQGYFTMMADRDIAAGEEVLHTYGDLSDAQLLQTYGFVEQWAPGEENPHNVAFIPAEFLVSSCQAIAAAFGLEEEEGGEGGRRGGGRKRKARDEEGGGEGSKGGSGKRRELLELLGVLPPNVVVISAERPLSDELLTVAQVMLMPQQDFEEYAEEFKHGSADSKAGGSSGNGKEGAEGGVGEQVVRGVLGRAYLDDPDFRHIVVMALLKAVGACLKRYPTTEKEDEALLSGAAGAGLSWRQRCAVAVRLGEKRVLERLKKALVELLAEGAEGSEGGSEEDTSSGSDSEDLSDSDSDSGSDGSDSEGEDSLSEESEPEPEPKRAGVGRGRKGGGQAPRGGGAAARGGGRAAGPKRQRK